MSSTTWNALLGILDPPQIHADSKGNVAVTNTSKIARKQRRCNTNLHLLKVHFKYQPWHKILDNKKLSMTQDDPLRMVMALYRNQQYLYRQIKALEVVVRESWGLSMDIVLILNSFAFNQIVTRLRVSGLSHDIKKRNADCFNWFHQMMFSQDPIEMTTMDDDGNEDDMKQDANGENDENVKEIKITGSPRSKTWLTKEQLIYQLDWKVLRSHVAKRQLLFR